MTRSATPTPQITVLDTGGQYTHLIARKVRELGVFADVLASEAHPDQLKGRRGIIISGGPSSVYEQGSASIDAAILASGTPVLGICYGHQLIAHHLGGHVSKGDRGEYGIAHLQIKEDDRIWTDIPQSKQIWMSHRDCVATVPSGFRVIATTENSDIAAMSDPKRRIYGLQFHPEVVHTAPGTAILKNFVFGICEAQQDWDLSQRVSAVEEEIREAAGDRNIFFFVSGGVDSTVAYTLCLRALGPERVAAIYVDTGLMRQDETEFVQEAFKQLGATNLIVDYAKEEFLSALANIYDPELKRKAIGEQFVKVQQRILNTGHFLDGHWILGQGTIYPDTIESGGTAKADLIKTHHNRVAGIQALIEAGSIVEPLTSFYKDEVREIGREIGVPQRLLARHPFPGPGLAIRCLCSEKKIAISKEADGWLLPVRSVGVQGDFRTYRDVFVIDQLPSEKLLHELAPAITNSRVDVNRVVAFCGGKAKLENFKVFTASLTDERLTTLRHADAIVRQFCIDSGFDDKIWQFPVVLIPAGFTSANESPTESVVLRPINSTDGMTADAVLMAADQLNSLSEKLLAIPAIAAVFYDLTHKPPGTIEWE